MAPLARTASMALVAGAIAAAAWTKKTLTAGGAVAATAVGTVVFARGGLPAAAALVAFFVTSSALSRFKEREKARHGVLAQAKGGERDARQVLANGGIAAACLGLGGHRGAAGFLGALATAGADTWATELGLLATHPPRLLTTMRPVPPGASGGVTPEGTLAALGGAATVGATWETVRWLQTGRPWGRAMLVASVAGPLGSLADSLLGATVQAGYWCPSCQEPTEARVHQRCGRPAERVRGWKWMDNDAVNALATATGALVGAAVGAAWRGREYTRPAGAAIGSPGDEAPGPARTHDVRRRVVV